MGMILGQVMRVVVILSILKMFTLCDGTGPVRRKKAACRNAGAEGDNIIDILNIKKYNKLVS